MLPSDLMVDDNGNFTIYDYAYDDTQSSDQAVIDQAAAAAESGGLQDFTNGLLQLGTTFAQLAMLYQNVESSRQLTPTALQNLQAERTYLTQQTQTSQTMWMWVALAAAGLLIISRR